MYRISFNEWSADEYKSLDGHQKSLIDKGLNKIKMRGIECGEALTGDLQSCRKIKLKKEGLRIVFRKIENNIEIIEIVAIGKRDKKNVYKKSSKRI